MGGIESVSFFHFWPAIGCFFISDILRQVKIDQAKWKYVPEFFYELIYFVAIGLMVLTIIFLIISLIKKGKAFFKELEEPNKYLEIFLVFVGLNGIAGLNPYDKGKCSGYEAFYWIHCVLCYLLLAYGLYLWLTGGKNFAVPELMILTLIPWKYNYRCTNTSVDDTTAFYSAISMLSFYIFFVVMFYTIKDQKMDPIIGISYVVILLYTDRFLITLQLNNNGNGINPVAAYAGFLLWCLLLGLVIADLIKCNWDFKKLMLSITALALIGIMWQNCLPVVIPPDTWEYTRKIYGILTLIGLYFSFVCAFLLAIVYAMTLIKGDSKK